MKIVNEREERIKRAKSLKREYDMLVNRISFNGILPAEREYGQRMIETTGSKIEWKLLEPQKKEKEREEEYDY